MMVRPRPAARATSASGDRRPSEAVVWRWRSITGSGRGVHARPGVLLLRAALALPLDQRSVLADQEIEVLPLLVRELEEDPLAFRVLETLAVALEETVRAALAADPDHQRLQVADALRQLIGAGSEEPVGRALEEEEGR